MRSRSAVLPSTTIAVPYDTEQRFRTLVQSPLRAGLLRFLHSQQDATFDVLALMAVFGRMRACTDILPVRILDDVEAVLGDAGGTGFAPGRTTYAEAALILRGHCVERLKQRQA